MARSRARGRAVTTAGGRSGSGRRSARGTCPRRARPPKSADHAHAQPHAPDPNTSRRTRPTSNAAPPEIVDIPDGGFFDLSIAPVAKRLGDATLRMLADKGSVPGPTLEVAQGSEVIINV
jgi:hypothetical protein